MPRLSRRAWNNVIIFAVGGMILIFQLMEYRQSESEELPQSNYYSLLPSEATILQLNLPQLRIERAGVDWKSEPQLEPNKLVQIIDAWMHIQLPVWNGSINGSSQATKVQIYIAGSREPIQLSLFQSEDRYVIRNWQGQILELDLDSYHTLFQ
ncbi:hypothetical protein DBZ36_00405 [Alginatibacterium sediminis]|uniref:DUF4340 domain-containing protein n=2 Tax=Alginatibacterium sediminis TaxID=2164068 RepID=A0A420ENA9_9ALTE|nr:hypothetical protein DBZ36_00405 [Alginatibacterium sediminis]